MRDVRFERNTAGDTGTGGGGVLEEREARSCENRDEETLDMTVRHKMHSPFLLASFVSIAAGTTSEDSKTRDDTVDCKE